MEDENVPFTPELFMIYYQQHLGRILYGFQAIESMIDIIISVYFGNKGTTDDLITFLHHLNFEIKIDALRIVTTNKCPELIKDYLVTTKYLLEGNQERDKFFKAIRSFKKLRNSIAHATVKNINLIDFSKYSLPNNPPDIEFIVFEKPINTIANNLLM